MKLIYFYILLLIPLLGVLFISDSKTFVVFLMVYALIYRPFLDLLRLKYLGLLNKSEYYKVFIPFWTKKHFKRMYFN